MYAYTHTEIDLENGKRRVNIPAQYEVSFKSLIMFGFNLQKTTQNKGGV